MIRRNTHALPVPRAGRLTARLAPVRLGTRDRPSLHSRLCGIALPTGHSTRTLRRLMLDTRPHRGFQSP
jgi:hypothetical protein